MFKYGVVFMNSEELEIKKLKDEELNRLKNELKASLSKEVNEVIHKLEIELKQKSKNGEDKKDANSLLILSTIQSQNEKLSKIEKNFKISKILIASTIVLFSISLFLTLFSWLNFSSVTYSLDDSKQKSEELLKDISNQSQIVLSSIKDSASVYVTKENLEYYHAELNRSFSNFARDILSTNSANLEKLNNRIVQIETKLSKGSVKDRVVTKKVEKTIDLKDLAEEYFSLTINNFESIDKYLKNKFINRLYSKLKVANYQKEELLTISKLYLKKILFDFKYIKPNNKNLNRDLSLKRNTQTLNFLKKVDNYLN